MKNKLINNHLLVLRLTFIRISGMLQTKLEPQHRASLRELPLNSLIENFLSPFRTKICNKNGSSSKSKWDRSDALQSMLFLMPSPDSRNNFSALYSNFPIAEVLSNENDRDLQVVSNQRPIKCFAISQVLSIEMLRFPTAVQRE